MSDDLQALRAQIDTIDDQVLQLVSERAALARRIGGLKQDGLIYRPEREAQILRRLLAQNTGLLTAEAIGAIFGTIMSHCRALEKQIAVAFLGPPGTFTEEAAHKQFGGLTCPVDCYSIDEVFQAVVAKTAEYGVVPVENSTEGAVGRTLDLLLTTNLHICGEVSLPVHQNLLSQHRELHEIRRIYSHAQSLAQCHQWIMRHLPHAECQAVTSNAEAAHFAAKEPQTAAIASKRAGQLTALHVLAENIEDDPRNTTRFLVLATCDAPPSGQDKTSLVMAAPNQPGAIMRLLEPLATHGVSMNKLESRPSRQGLWEYVFFVDIEGHRQDTAVAKALQQIEQRAAFLKVLGSYPIAVV